MSDIPWRLVAFGVGDLTAVIGSGLNSLANGGRAISAAINNTSGKPFISLRLYIAPEGVADSGPTSVRMYILPSIDGGTTYCYGDGSTTPPRSALAAVVDTARTTGDEAVYRFSLPAPAGYFKVLVINNTGGTLASSGNLFYYTLHGYAVTP